MAFVAFDRSDHRDFLLLARVFPQGTQVTAFGKNHGTCPIQPVRRQAPQYLVTAHGNPFQLLLLPVIGCPVSRGDIPTRCCDISL
jgi:hypothetical protein